jgi:Zn-dependent peptidase ImmA (M78 family)
MRKQNRGDLVDIIIADLIRKFKTNDPFVIAKGLNIEVRFVELDDDVRGFYYRKLRRRFIVINSRLYWNGQRFVCAHEIAHDRLHPGLSRFSLDESSFSNPGRYERQANKFGVKLLTAGQKPCEDESIEEFFLRCEVPVEMQKYY